jgi:hypothetical protein
MLSGTLLDDEQRDGLAESASAHEAMAGSRAQLERARDELRRYTPLWSAVRVDESRPTGTSDGKAAFDDARAAVAEAADRVTSATVPDELLAAIPRLLEPGSPGSAAVRKYWVDLGFAPADVDAYLAQAGAASERLVDVARLVRDVDDWDGALAHFGTGSPDPAHWGFGFSSDSSIDEHAQAFATTARLAGVTPSLYLVMTILLLLEKAADEVAQG